MKVRVSLSVEMPESYRSRTKKLVLCLPHPWLNIWVAGKTK